MKETAGIREELRDWATDAREYLQNADPEMPDGLTDRQEDCWSILFAIADLAGDQWAADAREWALILTRAIPSPPDEAVQILTDVKRVLDTFPGDRIATAKLAEAINSLPGKEYDGVLTANQLGRRLAGFGLHHDKSAFREGVGIARAFADSHSAETGTICQHGRTHSSDTVCRTCRTCRQCG